MIDEFNGPIRLDRNKNRGGVFLFVRHDILTKLFPFEILEVCFIEINLRKTKWFLFCSYNPDKNNIETCISAVSASLRTYSL